MADPMKVKRDAAVKKVLAAGPATPEPPGADLSLSPPLEGEDPEWDKIKAAVGPQSFVGSDKFNKMVRSAWGVYRAGKAIHRGGTPTVKIRGKF